MGSRVPFWNFCDALNYASRNRVLPLREYLAWLGTSLRVAAQRGECVKFSRHVEYLMIASTLVSICSWEQKHRKWSRRIGRMLLAEVPLDLRRALRRIDLKCRYHRPKGRVFICAPARWQSRSWLLEPIHDD
jgi:hypothetical protein